MSHRMADFTEYKTDFRGIRLMRALPQIRMKCC
jgi:hypothetical protein